MEINFNTSSSHLKYSEYYGKFKNEEHYIISNNKSNVMDTYDIFSKINIALVDLLNMGKYFTDIKDDTHIGKYALVIDFVNKYGLLGFLADIKNIETYDNLDLFFPFSKVSNLGSLNCLISNTSILNCNKTDTYIQNLIYSEFYCEKVDLIINYSKKMYLTFKSIIDFTNLNRIDFSPEKAREIINNYNFPSIPYKITMFGTTPQITWQYISLKQILDMYFGFIMCSEKPLKECKYCGNAFFANNPKAEYCSSQCRNKANVYKSISRSKNKNKN